MHRRNFLRTTLSAGVAGWGGTLSVAQSLRQEAQASSRPLFQEDLTKEAKILLIGHKPDHPPGTHLYLDECPPEP